MYSWIREWFGRSPAPGGAPPIVTGGVVEDGAAREETDVKNGVEEVCLQQCPENDWEKRNTALLLTSITLFTILICVIIGISFYWWEHKHPASIADKYPPGCLWVGHLSPDTDSYCNSYSAAELFNGSYSISEVPNRETQFVIDHFGFPNPPPLFKETYDNANFSCVGLVDHNQQSQSPVTYFDIPREKLAAIIDHHAIQSAIVTHESVIHIDIRPWGSTGTLIYEMFLNSLRIPSTKAAQCMLSAILSDTLGYSSPTTTEWDVKYGNQLAKIAGVEDQNDLYYQMGAAKSNISGYSTRQVLELDAKEYVFVFSDEVPCLTYWATLETFTPDDILDDITPYLEEMIVMKQEKPYCLIFFSVVNSLRVQRGETTDLSALLIADEPELTVANDVFGGPLNIDFTLMDLSPRVSRKKDFIPPVDAYISETPSDELMMDSVFERKPQKSFHREL